MKRNLFAGLVLVVVVAGALSISRLTNKSASPSNQSYTISDQSVGLDFKVSQNFSAISRSQLVDMNPSFLYGFQAKSDPKVQCIVAQTPLKSQAPVLAGYLRDGTLKAIKQQYSDAKLASVNTVKVGKHQGIFMQINYTSMKQKYHRVELVGVGSKATTFAYCQSLTADNAKYYQDFTTFFSSFKLTD